MSDSRVAIPHVLSSSSRLREADAAAYLGVAKDTLRVWRAKGRKAGYLIGPRYIAIGGAGRPRIIQYAVTDLDAYLAGGVVALEPLKKRGRPRKGTKPVDGAGSGAP